MRTQEPLKENPGGTNCVSRKADSFKGNFLEGKYMHVSHSDVVS